MCFLKELLWIKKHKVCHSAVIVTMSETNLIFNNLFQHFFLPHPPPALFLSPTLLSLSLPHPSLSLFKTSKKLIHPNPSYVVTDLPPPFSSSLNFNPPPFTESFLQKPLIIIVFCIQWKALSPHPRKVSLYLLCAFKPLRKYYPPSLKQTLHRIL